MCSNAYDRAGQGLSNLPAVGRFSSGIFKRFFNLFSMKFTPKKAILRIA